MLRVLLHTLADAAHRRSIHHASPWDALFQQLIFPLRQNRAIYSDRHQA